MIDMSLTNCFYMQKNPGVEVEEVGVGSLTGLAAHSLFISPHLTSLIPSLTYCTATLHHLFLHTFLYSHLCLLTLDTAAHSEQAVSEWVVMVRGEAVEAVGGNKHSPSSLTGKEDDRWWWWQWQQTGWPGREGETSDSVTILRWLSRAVLLR